MASKGVPESISFCLQENYDYDLVYDDDYYRFLWNFRKSSSSILSANS